MTDFLTARDRAHAVAEATRELTHLEQMLGLTRKIAEVKSEIDLLSSGKAVRAPVDDAEKTCVIARFELGNYDCCFGPFTEERAYELLDGDTLDRADGHFSFYIQHLTDLPANRRTDLALAF